MITEKQNTENMRKCPKFENCNIPKCPLDFWAEERTQLAEDKRCPNWKYAGVKTSKKDREGHIMPSLKEIVSLIGEKRQNYPKTGSPEVIRSTTKRLTGSLDSIK